MKNIIIFSDAGIDDIIAIFYLMKSKSVNIKAIIASDGNMRTERTYDILYHFFHKDTKIYLGQRNNMQTHFIHKAIEKLNIPEATERLVLENHAENLFSEKVIVLSLAPLTDVARVIEKFKESIEEIIVMGGAYKVSGNETLFGEYNFYQNPEAINKVLNQGLNITLIPLDVTTNVRFKRHHIDKINHPEMKFLLTGLLNHYLKLGEEDFPLHDFIAACYLTTRDAFKFIYRHAIVATEDFSKGHLIVDEHRYFRKKWNCKIAMETEITRFFYDFVKLFGGIKND